MAHTWWWGTSSLDGSGSTVGAGEGLYRMSAGGAEATLALELPAPTFIVAHPDLPLLYAISEGHAGASALYAIDISDSHDPRVVGSVLTGGGAPCHVLLARDTLALYVSHEATGELGVVRLGADGLFDSDAPAQMLRHEGTGSLVDRQEGPHALFAGYAPDGRTLLVCDLGTDELRRYDVLPDGLLRADGIAATLPGGSGPRHFVSVGSHIHVLCELDDSLRTLVWNSETRVVTPVVDQSATLAPPRTADHLANAHIEHVSGVLLASVRGANVISVFDLDGNGLPAYRGCFDTGGDGPRHFALAGERVVVGNERSHTAAMFDLADVLSFEAPMDDEGNRLASGIAELKHYTVDITSPACICPI